MSWGKVISSLILSVASVYLYKMINKTKKQEPSYNTVTMEELREINEYNDSTEANSDISSKYEHEYEHEYHHDLSNTSSEFSIVSSKSSLEEESLENDNDNNELQDKDSNEYVNSNN